MNIRLPSLSVIYSFVLYYAKVTTNQERFFILSHSSNSYSLPFQIQQTINLISFFRRTPSKICLWTYFVSLVHYAPNERIVSRFLHDSGNPFSFKPHKFLLIFRKHRLHLTLSSLPFLSSSLLIRLLSSRNIRYHSTNLNTNKFLCTI